MKKIINKKRINASLIGLSVLALVGCSNIEPDTPIPEKIGGIRTYNIDDNEVVFFDDLNRVDVYFEYTVSDNKVYYGSSLLTTIETEDFTAYYDYKSGNLVGINFKNNISDKDRIFYKKYLENEYIKVSSLEKQLYNPDNNELIKKGINHEEDYIDYDTLKLMEASMIPHNKEIFKEELDSVYKEKKLTR